VSRKAGDAEPELGPEDEALLRQLARRVSRYQMEVPAVLFLESVRPLNFVGSQALAFFEPMVQTLFNWSQYDRFTRLMAQRENVERLTRYIEEEADRRRAAETEGKKKTDSRSGADQEP
jgi:hypothetical protein